MIEQRISVLLLLVSIASLPLALHSARGQGQELVSMYMINPLTGNNSFDIADSPVNSVFTVGFYIGNVTDLITWQIRLTYNRTLIHYDEAWFPNDNVFKEAVDSGATPLTEVSNNVGNITDVGDLLIVMTSSHSPSNSLKYPVNVTSKALLCKVNFMIVSHPVHTKIDFVMNGSQSSSSIYITPPYYLPAYETSVETLSGIYAADGESAVVFETDAVPEFSALALLFLAITATPTLILAWIKRARGQQSKRSCFSNNDA
jgi:hypothetical protein